MAVWHRRLLASIPFVSTIWLSALWGLGRTPPLWWDEGWTLSVARNWVVLGHFGRLLNGVPVSPGLNASLPVTGAVALGFRAFGVGAWQGRFVGVLYTSGALLVLYLLTFELYDRRHAVASVLACLLLAPHLETHPLYVGRQAMAELPMLFWVVLGYLFFFVALQRSNWLAMALAAIVSGIALMTKAQVLPFWLLASLCPSGLAFVKRKWCVAGCFLAHAVGSYGVSRLLARLQVWLPPNRNAPRAALAGLYEVTALVTDPTIRGQTLVTALVIGLPSLLALAYALVGWIRSLQSDELDDTRYWMRLSLLVLAGSWAGWFVALSIGWTRYFLPVVFLSSPFVADYLSSATHQFDIRETVALLARDLHLRRPSWAGLVGMLAIVLVLVYGLLTLRQLSTAYRLQADTSVYAVAEWLNKNTPDGTLVETYESELMFLLDRPYHYPPDQVHVELNRRTFLGQGVDIPYDPLAADPEYLVVGLFGRMWDLYGPTIATGAFDLAVVFGPYQVYQRLR